MNTNKILSFEKARIQRAVSREEPCRETVISVLKQAIRDLETGREFANKVVIILYDDSGQNYYHQTYLGGPTPVEASGILDLGKDDCKIIADIREE
jgi:hypothetical protein